MNEDYMRCTYYTSTATKMIMQNILKINNSNETAQFIQQQDKKKKERKTKHNITEIEM